MMDRLNFFPDFVDGGAWPLVGRRLTRLVNSVNERDLNHSSSRHVTVFLLILYVPISGGKDSQIDST